MRKAVRAIIVRDATMLVMKRNKFGQEYYTLVGGAIDLGETADQALRREITEEAGLAVTEARLVFVEEAGNPYGTQYVYLCDDPGGEIAMSPDAIESKLNAMGKNTFTCLWLPITELPSVPFRSERLKHYLVDALQTGFPDNPTLLTSR